MNNSVSKAGFFDVLPLSIAVIPWGVLVGSLAIEAGFTNWQAQALSAIVFAGSAQIAILTLLSAGAGIVSQATTVGVISSRHLLYAAVMREHMSQLSRIQRLIFGFVLTDEMFAVAVARHQQGIKFSYHYCLVSGFTFYIFWNLATFAGIMLGNQIPNLDQLGLEFAIAATFIALTVPGIKNKPVLSAVLVAGIVSWITQLYAFTGGLILAAIAGMIAGYTVEVLQERSTTHNEGKQQ